MKSVAVVGGSEFTLGFQLAGIRNVHDVRDVPDLLEQEDLGIVIISEEAMKELDSRVREDVVSSISPVFVAVSREANQAELRKMIIHSIGVDILKDD